MFHQLALLRQQQWAQHDEVVMFLRQPSAATSLCEEGLSSTQAAACYSQQAVRSSS